MELTKSSLLQRLSTGVPASLMLLIFALTSTPAVSVEEEPTLEEVIVLGSHIPRADYTSISPVFTIDAEDLQQDSRQTMAELLNRYPQFAADKNANSTEFTPRAGATSLNLRGLGAQRNLVLLNGRRLGPSGSDAVVDVNQLPKGLIERVEVLTGGATTTYGSDAMSGVVNFTLRNDVDGVEIIAGAGSTDHGDGDTADISLLGGMPFAQGRGNVTGFLSYYNRDAVTRFERSFSAVPIDQNSTTGELYPSGSATIPAGRSVVPAVVNGVVARDGLTFDTDGNPQPFAFEEDRYNYNRHEDLQYALERTSGAAFIDFEINDSTRTKLALVLSRNETTLHYAPATLRLGSLLLNLGNPVLTQDTQDTFRNSYDPANTGLVVLNYHYRPEQVGKRKRQYDRDSAWLNFEIAGRGPGEWNWVAAYTHSDTDMKGTQSGGASETRLQQGVLVNPATGECFNTSNGCTPTDIFGPNRLSAAAVRFISDSPYVTRDDTSQQVISFISNGELPLFNNYTLPTALGLEWRRDKTRYRPDPALLDTTAFRDEYPISGKDDVTEAYGEILLPLAEQMKGAELLELELGVRYSDYSKIGGEWTWKSGLNWVPAKGLRLRASYQRAARAPNMIESYTPQTVNTTTWLGASFSDPCAASRRPQDFPGYTDLCIKQGIDPENLADYEPSTTFPLTETNSGNEGLDVEKADTYSLGGIWTPASIPGLTLSLDYYQIEIEDLIGYLEPEGAFQLCFLAPNDSGVCRGIARDPGGDVTHLVGSYYNADKLETKGYDLSANYYLPHTAPWGWASAFQLSVIANKVDSFEVFLGSGKGYDCAGKFGFPCVVGHPGALPKYSALTNITYSSGPVSASISWQWLDSVDNAYSIFAIPAGETYVEAVPTLSSQNYLDFNVSWQLSDVIQFRFNVTNLTDNTPPLIANNEQNTDSSTYDVLGRRYYAGITLSF